MEKILEEFNIKGNLIKLEDNKVGLINKTYIATYIETDGKEKRYLLQKINDYTIEEPEKIMINIENITKYLKKQMDDLGDTKHQVLEIIKTKDDKNLFISEYNGKKEYYRVYKYIENGVTYDSTADIDIVYNIGKAFGNFQKMLIDYPIQNLEETHKNFHNTKKNLEMLMQSIKKDIKNRAKEISNELEFVLRRKDICSIIVRKLEQKEIPLRIIHSDTKINNVMMNKETNDFLAVVDLDTIMLGSMLYDYGDGIRSATVKKENRKTNT